MKADKRKKRILWLDHLEEQLLFLFNVFATNIRAGRQLSEMQQRCKAVAEKKDREDGSSSIVKLLKENPASYSS